MKFQTSTRLALYSVIEFAARPGEQLAAADIAEKYGVSLHHLAKVLRELCVAGILDSTRGVGGGYRFAANAKRLTLMDVIERFEEIGAAPEAADSGASLPEGLALDGVLAEIDEIARATFHSITFDTMLKLVARRGIAGHPARERP
jgi:Rrf2 family protein